MPGNFFDSNILIYLASGDSAKADRGGSRTFATGARSAFKC